MGFDTAYRESFIQWAIDQGVEINKFVTIKESQTGGTGVFFKVQEFVQENGKIDEDDQIVLMRIPKKNTMSLDSIATDLLEPQLAYDADAPKDYIKQSDVFKQFLADLSRNFQEGIDPYFRGGLNETNILVGEIQILTILKKLRDQLYEAPSTTEHYKDFLKKSPFAKFDRYLDLLYKTEVNSLKLDTYYEVYKTQFKYNQREYRFLIEKAKNLAIFSSLLSIKEDLGFSLENYIDTKFLQKIEISVISRILEIPEPYEDQEHNASPRENRSNPSSEESEEAEVQHESDGYVEDDEDDGEEQYGFSVASTMVPIIDFVNHSNDQVNAKFDVDVKNGDVLLKYDNEAEITDEEIELFITYSEYEDVFNFINAYGFIPKSSKTNPVYEHAIDRDYLSSYEIENEVDGVNYKHNVANLLKWVGQAPNIQFVLTYDGDEVKDVKLNLDQNFIIFGFSKGLTYHPDRALEIIKETHGENTTNDIAKEILQLEESPHSDLVECNGQTPYTLRQVDENVDLWTIIENTPDEEVDELMIEFIKFLLPYFKYRIKELDNGLLLKAKNFKSIIVQFAVFEREILKKFLEIAQEKETEEDLMDFIIGADEIDTEWLKYRLNPRYISHSKKLEIQNRHLVSAFHQLGVDTD
ncbi:Cytochrome c lysine N-methyltransferase 1 [Wickerhamomyces ciferrii]|uniref:Cytochrome c lysine N-methyltransferase 1 n=1 Tax=Wickerhamomyces ciferrii (strain ATCC 14091 / BCRC 22168 / CBS 111 / JCM 3599 / NBRC 0793 / NRRL Y-1031 F-60-10) TaxID=1206466 RepID=K0KFB3_WICCF|nr:Cytochrome c lysine N-methyltransferase 1 [Wickerhamomyces ciferrii]CCH43800.1 Cytochrome c lysine N-methyltransferase 1 [Wickerhamomyces ciferrii]